MHVARAVGCEGSVVSVDLGGPEHVRIVFGAVEGVKEGAGLLLCLFEQGLERGDVLAGPALLDSDAGNDRDVWHGSSSVPVCLDGSCCKHQQENARAAAVWGGLQGLVGGAVAGLGGRRGMPGCRCPSGAPSFVVVAT